MSDMEILYASKKRENNMSNGELLIWMESEPQVKIDPITGCKEWQGSRTKFGYGQIGYKGKRVSTHRLIWYLNIGKWPEDKILHSCDNPPCINLKHLRDGSQQDNMRDMVKKGRANKAKGERAGRTKITEEQVIAIRKLWKTGRYLQKEIAEMYGVTGMNISHIVREKTWNHD